MTAQGNLTPHVLSLRDEEILLRSITSNKDRDDIVRKKKVPINAFSNKPEESVDLFTHITVGEAIRLGWGRAVARGKEKGQSRSLHGWLILSVTDGKELGSNVRHSPIKGNRHHVSIDAPASDADFAKHRHNLADISAWCEHPGTSFRRLVLERFASRDLPITTVAD